MPLKETLGPLDKLKNKAVELQRLADRELIKLAQLKQKALKRLAKDAQGVQYRLEYLGPTDILDFSKAPRGCFVRELLLGSSSYTWYYFYGMHALRPMLFQLAGSYDPSVDCTNLHTKTLQLPRDPYLIPHLLPISTFPAGYFNLIRWGFKPDQEYLDAVLEAAPSFLTTELGIFTFGSGQGRRKPQANTLATPIFELQTTI